MSHRVHGRVAGLAGALALAIAMTSSAEDAAAPESKLSIHGYLSQAYAASDGHQVMGITDEGTFDYRRAALLFRYAATENDSLILQVAQRRLGPSPVMAFEPDLKLDWAYYEHRFGTGTRVRVGKIPSPRGLLNETRYVGTTLPFYRIPYSGYQEGTFTSEHLDGVTVRHTLGNPSRFSLETTALFGAFSMLESGSKGITKAQARNARGVQVIGTTPLEGLRLIGGLQRWEVKQTQLSATGSDTTDSWNVGGELVRERFKLRSEYRHIRFKAGQVDTRAFYAYAGVYVTSKLGLHGQYDDSDIGVHPGGSPTRVSVPDSYHDWVAGTTYAFRPNVVVKGEYHWARGRILEDIAVPPSPSVTPPNVRYFIVSLSTSF